MSVRTILALLAGALTMLAAGPAANANPAGWAATAGISPSGGHLLGNPQATIKIIEYVSYTCPHCAIFEAESAEQLKGTFIASGNVSIEVRHFLRDPMDMAAALLSNCAAPSQFFPLHEALMRDQPNLASPSQQQITQWQSIPTPVAMHAIAAQLNLFPLAAHYGVDRARADHCLADKALMQRIATQTEDAEKQGITGTPSFLLNSAVLIGTHSWDTLQAQLAARLP